MEKQGFVIVPRDEYEDLLIYKRLSKPVKEFVPSKSELAALRRARKNYKEGKTISLDELKRKLGY